MIASTRPLIKICCIMSRQEARLAAEAGAGALGFVSHMPSGPGVIPDETIADIVRDVPAAIATFLLTSRRNPAEVIEHHRRTRTSTIQLVDRLAGDAYEELRGELPGIRIVQAIHVTGREAFDSAVAVATRVDAILLDSGNPAADVKELGGTGRRHDWSISRSIRETVPVPVYLAGGLRPENVREAIDEVGAYGLDVCSGVRTDGRLDPGKLADFIRAARGAAGGAP